MNLATLVSSTIFLVGIFFAGIILFISTAPGMKSLRTFAAACAASAFYALCNAGLSSSSLPTARLALRFSMLFIGLLGAAWYAYNAQRENRALTRIEKIMIAFLVMGGALSLVPHVLYRDEVWIHAVPSLGITYLDQRTTIIGSLVFGYCCICGLYLMARALGRFRNAGWTERAEAAGLVALALAGVNDSLVSEDIIHTPYLLDLAFLVLLLLVGASLGWRVIQNAHQLERAQQGLIRNERLAALGEMSAVVAHEVRTPTAVIFNAAALLRKSPEDREKLVTIIEDEAGRLKRLVDDFLVFARPVETQLVRFDVRTMLDGVAEAVRLGSGETITVQVTAPLTEIALDPRLVHQALVNLITNALQAEHREEPVCVTAKLLGDSWMRLEVRDDGAGIPPELDERIYLPFFTTRSNGTGLGLPLVQRIAKAHGGMLTHQTTSGGGATFNLDLPLQSKEEPRRSEATGMRAST